MSAARRARPAAAPGLRTWRWPALVLIPLLVAVAVVVDRRDDGAATAAALGAAMPTAGGAEATGSTWYCAGGTATGDQDGTAEQTVVVANASDKPVTEVLSLRDPKLMNFTKMKDLLPPGPTPD